MQYVSFSNLKISSNKVKEVPENLKGVVSCNLRNETKASFASTLNAISVM